MLAPTRPPNHDMIHRPLACLTLPLGFALGIAACDADPSEPPVPVAAYEKSGPYVVGNTTVTLHDTARNRDLRVEIWYPADASAGVVAAAGSPIEDFTVDGAERATFLTLLASAPSPGTNRTAHAARDAAALPSDGGAGTHFPVVAFSHCYDCTRFSTFTIAERLASHGVAVVAPDHTGGTLFDKLAGTDAPLDTTFLATRAADIRFALDRVLDPTAAELPVALRGRFDPERVGVFGHSFGGVTAGLVLMDDARPKAGLALAVPMENPLLSGVVVEELHVPLFFLLAAEDNSIGSLGNGFIQQNFTEANPPVYEVDVADAGHWSVTDICGITPDFDAGCTSGDARQTNGEAFTYLDIERARGIAASYTTAFFLSTIGGDPDAAAYLSTGHPMSLVTAHARK